MVENFLIHFGYYIKNSNYGYTTATQCKSNGSGLKHVFHKGSSGIDTVCATDPQKAKNVNASHNNLPVLQYPGVWLDSKNNDLVFNINTQEKANNYHNYRLHNIPIDKWVHITFILINNNIDLYVNCNLKRRYTLDSVPKINYGNFFIANYGGFMGYLSKLRYYNYALEPFTIMNLCSLLPDGVDQLDHDIKVEPPYLADDYWFNDYTDTSGSTKKPPKPPSKSPKPPLKSSPKPLKCNKNEGPNCWIWKKEDQCNQFFLTGKNNEKYNCVWKDNACGTDTKTCTIHLDKD